MRSVSAKTILLEPSIAPAVADILCHTKSVQELRLAFDHDGINWTPECYEDRGYELLKCLVDKTPWSELSATLEALSLEDIVLIPRSEGNGEDTWNLVLLKIAQ